jgi:predicted membrane-bound spermidine synthase
VSFLHALALRQQVAGSLVAPILGRAARASPAWLIGLALLPSALALLRLIAARDPARRRSLAAVNAVAATGACGMTWSLLILFSYQTRAGALYGRIGLLAALFMLGLALGGWLLSRSADVDARQARVRLASVTLAGLVFAMLMPAGLYWLRSVSARGPDFAGLLHGGLLLLAGVVTGMLFPVAAGALLSARRDARQTAGSLEAADHLGAAVAALAGGVLLIPALGLAGAAWLLAVLEGAALLGVTLTRGSR